MHNDQIKEYDFSNDDLSPRAVLQHLRAHDARMKDIQPILSLVKAAYETRFWKWVATRESTEKYRLGRPDRVEVNRLQSAIHDYLAALYPRRLDVSIARCATTVGDPSKAQLVANQWLNNTKMRTRLLQGAGQALLYRGAGAKVGFDSGDDPVLRRTWARIFPYWELLTDEQVHDEDDARFIGHVSYKPKGEVEAQYGIELNGQARIDYLADDGTGTHSSDKNTDSDMNAFVRVLEFCNLIDNFVDEHGNEHEGRLEIYIVDESNNEHSFKKPIWMGPLPLVDGDGKGMPHIAPLLFTRELEHPMKGLSYAERLLPQIIELNTFRSHAALAARRDARSYLYRRGAVSDEDLDKLTRGDDGVIIGVDRKYAGQLRDVVVPIQHGPISGNVLQMMAVAERDLESIKTAPTAALGFIKNVTAEAVKATVGHTESEFGRHAEELDKWMVQILRLFFAACVSAMQDTGDSSVGEDVTPGSLGDEELSLIDLDDYREEEQEEPEEREPEYSGQPDDADLFPEDEPSDLDEDEAVLIETVEVTVVQTDNPEVAHELATTEASIVVLDKDGEEEIHITAADLDSDFVIGFSETGRSPVGNVELRENILRLAPLVEQYFGLMLQGGSPSALATTMLKVLHDKFRLPPSFHPDALRLAAKEAQDEPSMMPEQPEGEGAPPAGGPPAGGPPAEGGDQGAQAIAQIAEIAQQDPAAALAMLAEVLPEDQHDILTAIASLPPEEQTQQILDLLSKLAPGGAPQAPESSPEEVLAQLAQIAQEDPAAALAMLAEVLPPEQHDILQKIGALPPEEQTQQILDLLSKLQPKPE